MNDLMKAFDCEFRLHGKWEDHLSLVIMNSLKRITVSDAQSKQATVHILSIFSEFHQLLQRLQLFHFSVFEMAFSAAGATFLSSALSLYSSISFVKSNLGFLRIFTFLTMQLFSWSGKILELHSF